MSVIQTCRAVADSGFLQGGSANPTGAKTYDFAKYSQKLHEIEKNLNPVGGVPDAAPLDRPNMSSNGYKK